MPAHRKNEEKAATWAAEYRSGLSVWKIGATHGVSGQTVWAKLKMHGVPRRPGELAIRKHPIRSAAFSDPNLPEAAYWLGLLYADGCMHPRGGDRHVVSLVANTKDEESLRGFLAFLGLPASGKAISYRPDKNAAQISVASKSLCAALRDLGVVPRKTDEIRFPEFLTPNAQAHFTRGYFDGDGCVHVRTRKRYVTPQVSVSFTGNRDFIGGLSAAVERGCGLRPTCIGEYKNGRTISARYEGRNKLLRLRSWMYGADASPSLSRKRSTFNALDVLPVLRGQIGGRGGAPA